MREATLTGATAADQMTLRRSNLALVLRSLRDGGPRSRARLATELGLNTAAVSKPGHRARRARAWSGAAASSAEAWAARDSPSSSTARPSAAVGAEVNVNHVSTLALDLAGEVVAERRYHSTTRRLDPDEVIDRLVELVTRTDGGRRSAAASDRSASPSASPGWSTARGSARRRPQPGLARRARR